MRKCTLSHFVRIKKESREQDDGCHSQMDFIILLHRNDRNLNTLDPIYKCQLIWTQVKRSLFTILDESGKILQLLWNYFVPSKYTFDICEIYLGFLFLFGLHNERFFDRTKEYLKSSTVGTHTIKLLKTKYKNTISSHCIALRYDCSLWCNCIHNAQPFTFCSCLCVFLYFCARMQLSSCCF